MNFVIFAPPSSGKSCINNYLAKKHKYNLFDCDKYMDKIFTNELRLKINDDVEYLQLKKNIIINKINDLDLQNTILDLGGGTVFRENDFINFLKTKNLKIIYLNIEYKILEKRLEQNKQEILKRKFLLNKDILNWKKTLNDYYIKYSSLKQYSDYVLEYNKEDTIENIVCKIENIIK